MSEVKCYRGNARGIQGKLPQLSPLNETKAERRQYKGNQDGDTQQEVIMRY